jgi:hypothetical protein
VEFDVHQPSGSPFVHCSNPPFGTWEKVFEKRNKKTKIENSKYLPIYSSSGGL